MKNPYDYLSLLVFMLTDNDTDIIGLVIMAPPDYSSQSNLVQLELLEKSLFPWYPI
jgi:hypothetical protein